MAEPTRNKQARRRGKRSVQQRSGQRQRLKRSLLRYTFLGALLVAVALAGYLVYLDRTITKTFEGRRWSVPAVIYAQPLELFPGASLSMSEVTRELQRLGYQASPNLQAPGTYKRTGNRLSAHLRAFRFMESERASQKIELTFSAGVIGDVRDATGRPVPLIRLDAPAIGSFFPSHGEDRQVLTPEQVPDLLRQSLIAVEDQNFATHPGFDPAGIARALWVNVRAGELQQGGSTLTQQLIKSYFLDNRRTLARKLRELGMAIILELRFSKADILNAYINEIYLGQDGMRAIHGFGLGAQFYFNKPLPELDTDEIATLIAIIRGPSYYNPFRHPDRTLARRNLVLDKMHTGGLIDDDQHRIAAGRPLAVVRGARVGGAYYPAFMDLVRRQLGTQYRDQDLTSDGLRIFTTLQPPAQDAVEQALGQTLSDLEGARELAPDLLQGAALITAHQTGEVVALAGGRQAGFDGFNRALNARRPIGSLIKPVVYLTALESDYHLASMIEDAPVTVSQRNATWTPENFDNEVYGQVPLVRALGDSLNLATVQLGLALGVDTVAARLKALTGRDPENPYPSLLLGAESMTPLEVTGLYGTFASGGFYMPPKAVIAVLDETGIPISHHPFAPEQRISPQTAATLNRGLQAVMQHGTGRRSRFADAEVAGKTGTSDDYRDSWFVGFDDTHLGVVWVGADDNTPTGLTGAAGALRVWDDIMVHLSVQPLNHGPAGDLKAIEYATGLLANADCADIVDIPVPEGAILQSKAGCGINLRTITDRLRAWLSRD